MELDIINNGEALLSGILEDVKAEAAEIISAAEKAVSNRRKAAEMQVKGILEDAGKQAEIQEKHLRQKMRSSADVEIRRINLQIRDRVIKRIINDAAARLSALIESVDTDEYREIILGWIVEAALGLNTGKMEVNTSAAEAKYLDKELLNEAARRVEELTGQKTEFTVSTDPPLLTTGIILKSKDTPVSFDNQITSRLQRYQSEIRKLIITRLFTHTDGAAE